MLLMETMEQKKNYSNIRHCWKNREKLEKAMAGDIVATVKLKNTSTNETLNNLRMLTKKSSNSNQTQNIAQQSKLQTRR